MERKKGVVPRTQILSVISGVIWKKVLDGVSKKTKNCRLSFKDILCFRAFLNQISDLVHCDELTLI